MNGLIGKKLGMTTFFTEKKAVASTVISVNPNTILQVKNPDKDGYSAVKLGFGKNKKSEQKGVYQKIQELRLEDGEQQNYKVGNNLDLDQFKTGQKITVCGISKGKGFTGVIKRHNFSRGPETHGSHHHRATGSIGQCASPSKVFKGKKMPGRMGQSQVSVKNLEITNIDKDNNLISVKGAVPGRNGSFLFLTSRDNDEN
ncbi:MAG: 50S ribosomal protein L3 [bacterium]